MSLPTISYEDAFFSWEDWAEPNPFDLSCEHEAACFHEAGHAVVGYRLGLGLSRLSVTIECRLMPEDETRLGYAFGGRYESAKRATVKASNEIKRRGYGMGALRHGVMTCAGPAAELRYRIETKIPRRLLGATVGDHEQVDSIDKHLARGGWPHSQFRPRSSFAFRRLVWREALRAVYQPEVWKAICSLADALNCAEWPEESGTTAMALPGGTAPAIIRSASRCQTPDTAPTLS